MSLATTTCRTAAIVRTRVVVAIPSVVNEGGWGGAVVRAEQECDHNDDDDDDDVVRDEDPKPMHRTALGRDHHVDDFCLFQRRRGAMTVSASPVTVQPEQGTDGWPYGGDSVVRRRRRRCRGRWLRGGGGWDLRPYFATPSSSSSSFSFSTLSSIPSPPPSSRPVAGVREVVATDEFFGPDNDSTDDDGGDRGRRHSSSSSSSSNRRSASRKKAEEEQASMMDELQSSSSSTSIKTSVKASTDLRTLEDVEAYVARYERQCISGGHELWTSRRDAIRAVVDAARTVVIMDKRGGGGTDLPPERAARLVERMLRACLLSLMQKQVQALTRDEGAVSLYYPPIELFNLAIMGWGNVKSEMGAQNAERIFELLMELQQQHDGKEKDGLKSTGSGAAASAVDAPSRHLSTPPRPDRRTYKSLIRAWAVAKCVSGPDRARYWLRVMEDEAGVTDLLQSEKEDDGGQIQPLTILQQRRRQKLPPPDRATYNVVLSGYANAPPLASNSSANLLQMTELVEHMDRLHSMTGSDEYRLDAYSYQALLLAYGRYVRSTKGRVDRSIIRDVEKWLDRMVVSGGIKQDRAPRSMDKKSSPKDIVPWSWAVGVLVEALVKSKEQTRDVLRAADYLRVLAGRTAPRPGMVVGPPSSSDNYPSQESIWKVIQALERLDSDPDPLNLSNEGCSNRDTIDELVRIAMDAPFHRIFFVNQAAEFWSQTGWRYAPDLIEQLMGTAWERSRRKRNSSSLKPTGQTFAIAMRAWLRCNDRDESPHRCELLLQQMLRIYQDTSDRYYRPRDEHLRSVLTCWLNRCSDGKRYHGLAGHLYPAEHIQAHLQWLVKPRSATTTNDEDDAAQDWIKNAAGHYSMAIRAWSLQVVDESDSVDRVGRAVQLLDDLERTTKSIPAFPCNWALELCARPQHTLEERKKAYDAAVDTFRRSERNARTFVLLVQVLKTHVPAMDQDHRDVIEDLVKECCTSGMLTQDLIWRVVELLDAESLQRLFGLTYQYATTVVQMWGTAPNSERMVWNGVPPSALLLRNLPPEWSCNIDRQRHDAPPARHVN